MESLIGWLESGKMVTFCQIHDNQFNCTNRWYKETNLTEDTELQFYGDRKLVQFFQP
jgi:hypothetical protein